MSDHAAIVVQYTIGADRPRQTPTPVSTVRIPGWTTRNPMEYQQEDAQELLRHCYLREASYAIAQIAERKAEHNGCSNTAMQRTARSELQRKMIRYASTVLGEHGGGGRS